MGMNSSRMDDLTDLPSSAPCGRVSLSTAPGKITILQKDLLPSTRGARNALASAPRLRDQRVVVAVSGKKNGHKPIKSRSAGQLVPVLGSDAQPNEAEVSRVSGRALPPQTTCTPTQLFALDSVLLPLPAPCC